MSKIVPDCDVSDRQTTPQVMVMVDTSRNVTDRSVQHAHA
jgi:hypothetical protein